MLKHTARLWLVLLVGAAIGAQATGAQAQAQITFTKIADTETPIPGGAGTFESLSEPALAHGNVVFGGSGEYEYPEDIPVGIYRYRGGNLSVVVDGDTDIPGCPCPIQFVGFSQPAVGAQAITFSGAADYGGCYCRGIYTRKRNADLEILADWTTDDPAGFGHFSEFFYVARCGRMVGFSAWTSGVYPILPPVHGIYRAAKPEYIELVANYYTPIPDGSGLFSAFEYNVSIGDGVVAFVGGTWDRSQWGLYTGGAEVTKVVDLTTPVPGSSCTFTEFSDRASIDRGCVAFHALTDNGVTDRAPGIYTNLGGQLRVVADLNTEIPDGTGNFVDLTSFYGPSIDGRRIAFHGFGEGGQQGVYCESHGRLLKVVDLNTALEPGVTLTQLIIDEQCLDGNRLGFLAFFETGTPHEFYYAVYVAQLPNRTLPMARPAAQ